MQRLIRKLTVPSLMLACTASSYALEKATVPTKAADSQIVSFDILLPLQNRAALEALLTSQQTPGSANYHKWLTPAQFHQRFDPSTAVAQTIQVALAAFGINTTLRSARYIHATGSAAAVELALATTLQTVVLPSGKATVVAPSLSVPPFISSVGGLIVGLSPVIHFEPHHVETSAMTAVPNNRTSSKGPYWFTDLKQAYQFPSYYTLNGLNANVGVMMAGGYNQADEDAYFQHEKLFTPKYTVENVQGGSAYDPNQTGTVEAALDLQQVGGMAPKSRTTLYSIPSFSDSDVTAGLYQVVEDNTVDVVDMAFGSPEIAFLPYYNNGTDYSGLLQLQDDIISQGNSQGQTFVASSGDGGALPIPAYACFQQPQPNPCGTFQASVEFPASSPHVTGVGGTNLVTTSSASSLDSQYVREQAYADPLARDIFYGTTATGGYFGSGGGNSRAFAMPSYQNFLNTANNSQRAVPDVAMHMGGCPAGTSSCNPDDSSDVVSINGSFRNIQGTSASASDFTGVVALAIQQNGGRLGNLNPQIYLLASAQYNGATTGVYNTTIPGYNGFYPIKPNTYSRVLGVGTVNVKQFLMLPNAPSAGTPQTPSNP